MDHRIEDKLQTMMAMTQHIQNRIVQSSLRGKMSEGVAEEIKSMAKSLSVDAYKISQFSKEKGE